jgi:hypothetical protein
MNNFFSSTLLSRASDINDLTQAFFSIIGGIFAISGICYLHTLNKKKAEVTFGFWSQLLIRLTQLKLYLENDNAIINNLFSADCTKSWTTEGAPTSSKRIKEFQALAKDTILFLKSSSDQLPAYRGWTDDYVGIIEFLDEILFFDISEPKNYFKYDNVNITVRKDECDKICKKIDNMITGIKNKQFYAEDKLYKNRILALLQRIQAKRG